MSVTLDRIHWELGIQVSEEEPANTLESVPVQSIQIVTHRMVAVFVGNGSRPRRHPCLLWRSRASGNASLPAQFRARGAATPYHRPAAGMAGTPRNSRSTG